MTYKGTAQATVHQGEAFKNKSWNTQFHTPPDRGATGLHDGRHWERSRMVFLFIGRETEKEMEIMFSALVLCHLLMINQLPMVNTTNNRLRNLHPYSLLVHAHRLVPFGTRYFPTQSLMFCTDDDARIVLCSFKWEVSNSQSHPVELWSWRSYFGRLWSWKKKSRSFFRQCYVTHSRSASPAWIDMKLSRLNPQTKRLRLPACFSARGIQFPELEFSGVRRELRLGATALWENRFYNVQLKSLRSTHSDKLMLYKAKRTCL